MGRRSRAILFVAVALIALASLAIGLRPGPPPSLAAGPTPEFKPKVWDFPGHNFW